MEMEVLKMKQRKVRVSEINLFKWKRKKRDLLRFQTVVDDMFAVIITYSPFIGLEKIFAIMI